MAKSEEREAELRHARLSNMRGIVPSLSGQHHRVHAPKAKSKALEGMKHLKIKDVGKKVGFSKTAKDLLEPKKGHKILKGYEY